MKLLILRKEKLILFTFFTIHSFFVFLFAGSVWGITIDFLGGTGGVKGSSILLDTGKEKILIDCGSAVEGKTVRGNFDFDPSSIDYLFITHAHNDHIGRIPELIERGFKGRIIGTKATRDLLTIVLRQDHSHSPGRVYHSKLIETILAKYEPYPYRETVRLRPGLIFRLHNAGHILGSSVVELVVGEGKDQLSFVFSGDLGSRDHLFLGGPDYIERADYVIVEGTYGPVKKMKIPLENLGKRIGETLKSGGSVLIPAFALDRTQQVLFALREFKCKGFIPKDTPVYADSKTAKEITEIYRKFINYFDPEYRRSLSCERDPFYFRGLKWVSKERVLSYHSEKKPAIFLTSGGILEYGNVLDHLSVMAEDPKNLLVIVNHQPAGSLGDKLLKGQRSVCIPRWDATGTSKGDCLMMDVRMSVMPFQGFAGHADGYEILEWLSRVRGIRKVFVVHGDYQNVHAMARTIKTKLGLDAVAPRKGEIFIIDKNIRSIQTRSGRNLCASFG
ncbi:MAG: MBL fold metallo-hydrolase [Syntrophales bacterium]|nr:MBL fold metallo-hydrolase [Syntrophales bacterium]